MKKIVTLVLAALLVAAMGVQMVFAEDVSPGQDISVTGFEDKSGNVQSDGWNNEDYKVNASYSGTARTYVERTYISDDDGMVHIVFKTGVNLTSDKDLTGTIRITEKRGSRDVYTLTLQEGDLTLIKPMDVNMYSTGSKTFAVPSLYSEMRVRFVEETTGEKNGTLSTDLFDMNGEPVAYYEGKIYEQPSLYLYATQRDIIDIIKKYEDATLRFVRFPANPSFEIPGKLTILMEEEEYLYQIGDNNKLTQVKATYDPDQGGYTIATGTLGSYVISDVKLSGAAAGSSSSAPTSSSSVAPPASSSKPASSSSVAPPASSSKPVTSSSSVAPPPSSSSSVAESISSSESSSESSEPESSEPVSSEPESSEPESSSSSAPVVKPEEDEGSFPTMTVVIVLVVVLLGGVAAYFIIAKKGGKKGGKNYDSWDD